MKKEVAAEAAVPELQTIEDLAKAQGVPEWMLAGAKVHYGWGAGKQMSAAEFKRLLAQFARQPIGGGETK